ncbi:MAG: methyltransferase domain-containing protein [Spirochaetales bacterium]|nr:methyltransferase domain-containing protein [Spirochaetales bacterium]
MNSPADQLKHSYDSIASDYALVYSESLQYKAFDQKILDHFAALAPEGNLCDLGCGPGTVTSHLAGKSRKIIGADFSRMMVETARSQNPEIDFFCENALGTNFKDESFTGLTALGLIQHYDFNSINFLFKEAFRLLKPGGIYLLNYYVGQGSLFVSDFLNQEAPMNYYFYKKEEIHKALTTQGFLIDIFLERESYKDFELNQSVGFVFARKTTAEKTKPGQAP